MSEMPEPTPVADGPTESLAFTDADQEAVFRAASETFVHPPKVQQKSKVLLLTIALFAGTLVMTGGASSLTMLVILVGVLLVHELGHALAMIVSGYRDVRIFFIPFFGAAASGRMHGVARWKEGVVLLAGPMPGIIAGVALLATGATGLAYEVATMLIYVNAFNLLPIVPLDGGQLFQLVVFSRKRSLEVGFSFLAAAAMIALAVWAGSWVLGIVGGFTILTLSTRKLALAKAEPLRELALPSDPASVDEPGRRALFKAAWEIVPPKFRNAKECANWMETIHQIAIRKPLSLVASAGTFVAWAGGVALSVVGAYFLVVGQPADWKRHEHPGGYSIELPSTPTIETQDGAPMWVSRWGKAEFGVVAFDIPPGATDFAERTETAMAGNDRVSFDAPAGTRDFEATLSGVRARVLITPRGSKGIVVIAAGATAKDRERTVKSFRFTTPDPAPPPSPRFPLPPVPDGAEAVALSGEPLARPVIAPDELAKREQAYADARDAHERTPGDVELAIWHGRRLGYLNRFRDAVDVYSTAIEQHPTDARLYRHRGHRLISLRLLDLAIADFEKAVELRGTASDEIEPDGMPNASNTPTSTLDGNIWYHLGLAYYLRVDFEKAQLAFDRCMAIATNDDSRVAAAYWQYLVRMQRDLRTDAAAVLAKIPAKVTLLENHAYHALLRLFAGAMKPAALASDDELDKHTIGYGLAMHRRFDGDRDGSLAALREVIAGGMWPAFGYIAAEAELVRASADTGSR
jgi:tetratricopeptide (TPR) repeat protein/Zn-dependent protease